MVGSYYWHDLYDPENPSSTFTGNTSELAYVGLTDASVEVETKDGKRYRITNPNFLNGLKIEVYTKENK